MKKVLVFNGYYIPAKKYGGPTTSMATIVDNCSDNFQFYIVAANHDLNDNTVFPNINPGWNDVGKAKVLYLDTGKIAYSIKRIQSLLGEVKPDLVWLVGILVPASKWNVALVCKKNNIPILVSPRGEVCDNTFHKKYLKKAIIARIARLISIYKGAYYHATSVEEIEGLVKYYGAKREQIFLVPNISISQKATSRSIIKNKNEIKVVFISRIMEKKNLLTAIKAVEKLDATSTFDIYGPIESEQYWDECNRYIANSPDNISIMYGGQLKPEEVRNKFSEYHAFIFPTYSENYGHAIVEALSISCPVVLSKNTTPWDDLDGVAGYTADIECIDDFAKCLSKIADMGQEEYNELMRSTAVYFDRKIKEDDAVSKHIQMLNEIMSD